MVTTKSTIRILNMLLSLLVLLQILPYSLENRLPKSPLLLLLESANNTCLVNNLSDNKQGGRMMEKDEVPVIANSLTGNGFCFNSTKDTVLLHIRYTELLQKKGAITATIDAYSSMGELHLDIVSGVVQHSFEHAYPGIDIERVIRNDPKCFFSIYDLYGVSDFTDGSDDRSIRIEIMNGQIVSSVAYQYSLFIDELAEQRISKLLK